MRKYPYIFFFVILIISCSSSQEPESSIAPQLIGSDSHKDELNDWLNQFGIKPEYFRRTNKGVFASVWEKEYELELWLDSLNHWYYSTDSSFVLFTNFHPTEDFSYEISDGSITTDFYDTKTGKVYRNFSFSETDSIKMIDIHWENDSVIYFLSGDKQSMNLSLLEIIMFNDSVIQYKK